MAIPKYILHPSGLIFAGAVGLWLVWTKVPTSTEVRETFLVSGVKIADRAGLSEIADFTPKAEIVFTDSEQKWTLASARFETMNDKQYQSLRRYLKAKLLKKPTTGDVITLPLELYDPVCFTPAGQGLACPFVIKD